MTTQQKIQVTGAAVLLLCVLPLPYGFFMLVRVAMTIIGGYLAYKYYEEDNTTLALTFCGIVLLFQPFFKIALGRELWLIVDIIVAIFLLALAVKKK